MNRRIWKPLLLVVLCLLAASLFDPGARDRVLRFGVRLAALWPSGHSPAASPAATSARFPIELLLAAGAGLVLLGLIGLTVVTVRRRRAAKRQGGHGVPWKSVVTLAKRGQPISLIARQTGLAQDAVRIVLAPIEAETVIDRGSSFRSGDRPDADAGSGPRLGRRA